VIAGLILAGGESRRFGSDKASLRIGGETMLERTARVLAPLVSSIAVSVRGPRGLPWTEIVDASPGEGPLAALAGALPLIQAKWCLVVACDYPHLDAEVLRLLISHAGDDVEAVVPRLAAGIEPLLALYRVDVAAPACRRLIEEGRRAARALSLALRTRWLDEQALCGVDPALRSFHNLNTVREFEGLLGPLAVNRSIADAETRPAGSPRRVSGPE